MRSIQSDKKILWFYYRHGSVDIQHCTANFNAARKKYIIDFQWE